MVSGHTDIQQHKNILKALTKTWSRDSHGLFDYEATNTKNNPFVIKEKCKLIRKKNEVRLASENIELDLEERELAKIKIESNGSKYIFLIILRQIFSLESYYLWNASN